MERMFRLLRAEEIDARVSTVNDKGCSLLLYKDARVDQNILDETVGAFGWQRNHSVIDGNLYCSVGIMSASGEWVWKQDVGTESYTEKEKGQASDSFKRACFNWGIGRELYTAPFIWVPAGKVKIEEYNGRKTTRDTFSVKAIGYDSDGNINRLIITNSKTNVVVYTMGEQDDRGSEKITAAHVDALKKRYPKKEQIKNITDHFGINSLEEMTVSQLRELLSKEDK